MPPARTRLFLVDDHQLFLEGLKVALQSRCDVVGVSTKGLDVVESCRTLRPDVVLLDLSLPDRSGLEIVADLHAELSDIRVIVVTMHADRVMAGERYVSGRIPRRVVTHSTLPNSALGISQLTPRQRVIVRLIGEGKRTVDIAEELGVTCTAITWHRINIRKALGLESEWESLRDAILVRMSEEEGSTPPA